MFDIGNGVAAHRGNMSEFPENTMASFESAIQLGCSWLELDIQRSLDGVLVITHDESAQRTTGQHKIISNTPIKELRQLNFGQYFGDNKFYELPLLSELMERIKNTEVRMTIQPKANGLVKDAIKLAQDIGVLSQIAFNEVNCEYLIEAKYINPAIPVFWDRLQNTEFETDLYIAKKFGFETLMYLNEAISEEKVKEVYAQEMHCGACVVNDFNDMDKYISWGVKMFYTDYPEALIKRK